MGAMMLLPILLASVFATSVLSGVLGMAGGMILMAILLAVFSVPVTMMVHGAVQATANGSRAWFLRQHIAWAVLPPYLLGAAAALGLFYMLAIRPNEALILIVIGSFPFLARLQRWLRARQARADGGLDITRPGTAVVCGAVVTGAQLFAGVSGPLLDVFYLNTPLDRFAVVASKALTQAIGHILKLGYWGTLLASADAIPVYWVALAMVAAVLGTRTGTLLLARWNQDSFQKVSGAVVLTIGGICLVRGLLLL